MSTKDYVKFVTEQVVTYMDTPATERKKRKMKPQSYDPIYGNRWLGVIPFALRIMVKKRNKQA
ncbi:MAG: YqzE family protein [Bacillota bacterium]|uniref:YqzE family protein n=1 Tax=Virgibacillus salarius TaxID=447199 RepID=A0A941ICW4_9BACI|nr:MULTISPECIES: YqzE family protein [Bacillaceae]NAZ10502.1 YqzE family protein [Agaribacter marinus]MBR7797792.1 YqzE family protein [Virgibacillus salarius]MCC2252117.1 YqzE family protein [Virgibacillus sp. AGTR]MDY7046118.1 YqzE family protein [Virgibacillus sp. M23]QRZ17395.1 YqzE family protein [Virgibacillus sp. AGTR]